MFMLLAEGTGNVTWTDIQSVITSATSQISVSTVVTVLGGIVGICIGLVFMWWGVRKGARMLMSAFKKGRLSV